MFPASVRGMGKTSLAIAIAPTLPAPALRQVSLTDREHKAEGSSIRTRRKAHAKGIIRPRDTVSPTCGG